MTHDHLGQGHEPHGHSADIHQFSGKDEKGHGQQRKGVDPSEQAGVGHNERHLLVQEQEIAVPPIPMANAMGIPATMKRKKETSITATRFPPVNPPLPKMK